MSAPARFVLTWAFNLAALWVAARLVDGVDYRHGWHLVAAALVFAAVNWLVRPVLTVLALPFIVLTLGVALFLINLLMLYVTSWVAPGFVVDGFWQAVLATVIIWAVNVVLRAVFRVDRRGRSVRRR